MLYSAFPNDVLHNHRALSNQEVDPGTILFTKLKSVYTFSGQPSGFSPMELSPGTSAQIKNQNMTGTLEGSLIPPPVTSPSSRVTTVRPDFQQYRFALHVLGLCVCGLSACFFVSGILSSPACPGPPSTLWPVAVTGSFLSLCRQSFIKETTLHEQDRCPQGGPLLPCFSGGQRSRSHGLSV